MQLTRSGEVLYISVQMKFDSAISREVDQVQTKRLSVNRDNIYIRH